MGFRINQSTANAIVRGQRIEAIKQYRAFSGASLLEAKTAVEEIWSGAPYDIVTVPNKPVTFSVELDNGGDEVLAHSYEIGSAGQVTFYKDDNAIVTFAAGVWRNVVRVG